MSKLNITVIGCGWLGLPLGAELVKSGYIVRGSTRTKEKLSSLSQEGIDPFHYDLLLNPQISTEIIRFTDVLVLTIPPIQNSDVTYFGQKITALCDQFQERTKIIFISSTGVYPQKSGRYDEQYIFTEQEKQTSLFQAEHALKIKLGSKLTVLRLGGLIGPNRHPVMHLQGQVNVKNPDAPVNLVHQMDVIAFILNLIEHRKSGGIFNLTHPEHPNRKEYFIEACQLRDLNEMTFQTSTQLKRRIVSKKAMEKLGFNFKHNIRHI